MAQIGRHVGRFGLAPADDIVLALRWTGPPEYHRVRALAEAVAAGLSDRIQADAAIYLVLLFVTLPFVVRTVQPVLHELDVQMEEAARSLGAGDVRVFFRVILPSIVPGILSGVAMAFARAIGEIGSVVIISGNRPFRTEMSSVWILNQTASGNAPGAAAVAVLLLTISFVLLLAIGGLRRLATRYERA